MCVGRRGAYALRCDMLPLYQWLVLSPPGTEHNSAELDLPALLPSDWLFNASNEPVLIVRAASGDIVQANPAAASLFGRVCTELAGTKFLSAFDKSSSAEIRRCLALAQNSGSAQTAALRTLNGSSVRALLSLVRSPAESYMLIRLDHNGAPPVGDHGRSVVLAAIECAPVGFVLTESGFHIDYANRAFAEMVELKSAAEVHGSSLLRWLRLTDEDLARLSTQLSQREAATLLTTQLCPAINSPRRVEICAIPVPDAGNRCWGFTVRDLPRLN
jgi:PAS domain-containing protein